MRIGHAGNRWVRGAVFGGMVLSLLAGTPAPARADCLNEAIASCNADFSGAGEKIVGTRGWCYMIRWGMCKALDE